MGICSRTFLTGPQIQLTSRPSLVMLVYGHSTRSRSGQLNQHGRTTLRKLISLLLVSPGVSGDQDPHVHEEVHEKHPSEQLLTVLAENPLLSQDPFDDESKTVLVKSDSLLRDGKDSKSSTGSVGFEDA